MGDSLLTCMVSANRTELCPGPTPIPCSNALPSSPPTSAASTPHPNWPAVSRSAALAAYKWLARYHEGGPEALADRSHAVHAHPHQTPPEVEVLIVEARRAHPTWGPRKLLPYLARRYPDVALPAASTAGAMLKRHGLVEPRRRRRRPVHPGGTPVETSAPGEVWATDFKGEFKTRDGLYCYPLTVTDAHSRYLLCCHGLLSTAQKGVFPCFEHLFKEHGLPKAIRTDNGNPFATQALCGLSKLNVWWIKLGIDHQRIEVGRPEQNGRHERMHRTLKAEPTRPPERDLLAQQRRFDAFRREFNWERPHEALSHATPASAYQRSPRPMPPVIPEPDYPAHWEKRWVSKAGPFRFKKRQLFLSQALRQEWIALEEVADGVWSLYFYDRLLARLDEHDFKLYP